MFEPIQLPDAGMAYWRQVGQKLAEKKRLAILDRVARANAKQGRKTTVHQQRKKHARKQKSRFSRLMKLALADKLKSNKSSLRTSLEYDIWRRCVLKRDGFRCIRCGSKKAIVAHHIKPWAVRYDLRFRVSNGITLCGLCHASEHPWMYDNPDQEHLRSIAKER